MRIVLLDGDTNRMLGEVEAKDKSFKTGSRGYFMHGKVTVNGKRYQVSGNLVEIGSKPNDK